MNYDDTTHFIGKRQQSKSKCIMGSCLKKVIARLNDDLENTVSFCHITSEFLLEKTRYAKGNAS